jgi:hypothetical protein
MSPKDTVELQKVVDERSSRTVLKRAGGGGSLPLLTSRFAGLSCVVASAQGRSEAGAGPNVHGMFTPQMVARDGRAP